MGRARDPFGTIAEAIDSSTAAGRLVAGLLGAIAQFERDRIKERIHAGLSRVRAGEMPGSAPIARGAPTRRVFRPHAAAAVQLGVSTALVKRLAPCRTAGGGRILITDRKC